jgi:hypothetical protein
MKKVFVVVFILAAIIAAGQTPQQASNDQLLRMLDASVDTYVSIQYSGSKEDRSFWYGMIMGFAMELDRRQLTPAQQRYANAILHKIATQVVVRP